jgi:hypothetical protein
MSYLATLVFVLWLGWLYYKDHPFKYEWVGGVRGGYIIKNLWGVELFRVWSEGLAKRTLEKGYANRRWLVDEVLKRRSK